MLSLWVLCTPIFTTELFLELVFLFLISVTLKSKSRSRILQHGIHYGNEMWLSRSQMLQHDICLIIKLNNWLKILALFCGDFYPNAKVPIFIHVTLKVHQGQSFPFLHCTISQVIFLYRFDQSHAKSLEEKLCTLLIT